MTATEIAVKQTDSAVSTQTAKAPRFTPEQIAASDIDTGVQLPDLAKAQKHFVPLSTEYWTPVENDEKLVYIAGIAPHDVPDMETGEIKSLECVMMLEHQGDVLMRYISASKVLVGNIRDAINRGEIIPNSSLTPVSIKFLGQKKNKSNARLSNRWQILPIIVNPV